MFAKPDLLSQDEPREAVFADARTRICACGCGGQRDPQVFDWNKRQREDLEAPWRDPDAEGACRAHLYCALTS